MPYTKELISRPFLDKNSIRQLFWDRVNPWPATGGLALLQLDVDNCKLLQRSARSGVPLLAPQSIAVTAVINLPASGGRKEFVYDQPFLSPLISDTLITGLPQSVTNRRGAFRDFYPTQPTYSFWSFNHPTTRIRNSSWSAGVKTTGKKSEIKNI